jgi:serine/threonine-protein kinase RsbW/stage II sporulation protein AB (anti-sigma F factor)
MTNGPSDSAEPLELKLDAVPPSVPRARRLAADYAERNGAEASGVELAVAEAVANCVLHGFRDREPGTVCVRVSLEPEALVVVVADDGTGMQPNPGGAGLGLGLPLIGQLTSTFTVSERKAGGTALRMTFPLLGRQTANA